MLFLVGTVADVQPAHMSIATAATTAFAIRMVLPYRKRVTGLIRYFRRLQVLQMLILVVVDMPQQSLEVSELACPLVIENFLIGSDRELF